MCPVRNVTYVSGRSTKKPIFSAFGNFDSPNTTNQQSLATGEIPMASIREPPFAGPLAMARVG
jgi:hypothetical protein